MIVYSNTLNLRFTLVL